MGLLYWLSHAVEQRQDEITAWLSKQIEQPVTIKSADIGQLGLLPKLHIEQLEIWSKDRGYTVISVESIFLGLDVLRSIEQSEAVLDDISIQGLKTAITRNEDGKLAINGLDASFTRTGEETDWFGLLSLLNNIDLQNVSVDYIDTQKNHLTGKYHLINATLEHDDSEWVSLANIDLPSSLGQSIDFHAQANIKESLQETVWKSDVNMKKLQPSALAHDFFDSITIDKGLASIEISIEGKGNNIATVFSSVQLDGIKLVPLKAASISPVTIEKLNANVRWLQTIDGWKLLGQNLAIAMNGELWPETNFSVIKKADQWFVNSNYLKLSDLSSIALLTELSPEIIRKQLPAGDLNNLELQYSQTEGLKTLAFDLTGGAFSAWKDYPGISGLTFSLNWQDGLADIDMKSHKLHIYADKWLKKSVYFDSVMGAVKVQYADKKSLSVETKALRIWNDDLTLQLDGVFKHFDSGKTDTNLLISLEDVQVNTWKKYIPLQILEPDLRKWAAPAFVNGIITEGKIELVGDLADFPYDKQPEKGRFKMDLTVENTQLHFAEGWPNIEDVNGSIHGLGNDLTINSNHGSIAGFKFVNVTTKIKRLMITKPVLTVNGSLTGTTNQGLEFLRNSPLKQRFSRAVDGVVAKGNSDLELHILVPLTNVNSTQAKGNVSFKNSELRHQSIQDVGITKINGLLNFNNDGVDTKNDITGTLLGQPMSVAVTPSAGKTVVKVNGTMGTEAVNTMWPMSIPSYFNGIANYSARLNVKEKQLGEFYVDGDIFSDLKGVTVTVPKPFYKTADEKASLILSMNVVKDKLHYLLNYNDILQSAFSINDNKWKANVVVGKGVAPQLPKQGFQFTADLDHLSVDKWLSWIDEQDKSTNNSDALSQVESLNITLKANTLTGFDYNFTKFDAEIEKHDHGWKVKLNSDQAVGNIYYPFEIDNTHKLVIDLDKFALSFPEKTTQDTQASSLWPAMKISIESLSLDDALLGTFTLDAEQSSNKWTIESAILKSGTYNVTVDSAEWLHTPQGDSTQVAFQIHSNNLGETLSQLKFQRAIESKKVGLVAELEWNGAIMEYSRSLLNGYVGFTVDKGRLNDVDSGAGGRVLGLMSITALPRRLSLDFSDLFAKGLSFDSINGSFDITDGIAETNDFLLKGPAAKVDISGKVDLGEQQYDQVVKITPNVSSTLPWAGAIAGGPVGFGVGAAIVLADKLSDSLLGKNIVNIISYKYSLSGPWENPEFKVLESTSP